MKFWKTNGFASATWRRSALLLVACGSMACANSGTSRTSPAADWNPFQAREFAPPSRIRPCCLFGYKLTVTLATIPIPALELANVANPLSLGRHTYDGGLVSTKHPNSGFISKEKNGLVYTCRAGFVDVAHVRDYADRTVSLYHSIVDTLETGAFLPLPDEGGRRFVYLAALGDDVLDRWGRQEAALALAQWLAFEASIWHEIATWYGWSSTDVMSEQPSAFSPEDLYSNRLGALLAAEIISQGGAGNESEFNESIDRELPRLLGRLGALPPSATRKALDAVDDHWWNSRRRVPEPGLVLKRYLNLGPMLVPWRVPDELLDPELRSVLDETCVGELASAEVLGHPDTLFGIPASELARVEVKVNTRSFVEPFHYPRPGQKLLSHLDFREIVESIRQTTYEEYGYDADRP